MSDMRENGMEDDTDFAPPVESLSTQTNFSAGFSGGYDRLAPLEQPSKVPTKQGRWIVVFGFAPNQLSRVLSYLQTSCGQLIEYRRDVAESNWVEVLFESNLSANNALNLNGKVILEETMIGVLDSGKKTSLYRKKISSTFKKLPSSLYLDSDSSSFIPFQNPPFWKKITDYIFGVNS